MLSCRIPIVFDTPRENEEIELYLASDMHVGSQAFNEKKWNAFAKLLEAPDAYVFGSDSYGVVDVAGQGAIKAIIKPLGSSGTADPLDQRATVGAKVTAFTACVLNPDWLVSIHHGVTA